VTPPPDFVDLLYFEVESVDGTEVTLSWATGAEVGTYGFNIYRSGNDSFANATLVGFEPARGGRETTTYEFTDSTPSEGMYWYFLEEVSTQGGKGSSGVIGTAATVRRVFVPFLVVRSRP
jgi:hypothetical protein